MLPAAHRMRSSGDFARTIRAGVRAGRPTLVVHAVSGTETIRVGLVVAKAVGNAVQRNRVKRRLRHLLRDRLDQMPAGTSLVVRALPGAVSDPDRLPPDLDGALTRARQRLRARP